MARGELITTSGGRNESRRAPITLRSRVPLAAISTDGLGFRRAGAVTKKENRAMGPGLKSSVGIRSAIQSTTALVCRWFGGFTRPINRNFAAGPGASLFYVLSVELLQMAEARFG
jgi:hypothetical protein